MREHHDGTSTDTLEVSTVDPIFPPGQHTWAELLRLVAAVRRIAYDPSLADDDRARRIRDEFRSYDEGGMS